MQDLQSAWLLLLFYPNARATYSLRGIPPSEVADFAEAHEATWQCFMRLLSLPLDTARRDLASLPFQLGGCGLLNATRSRVPTHWASRADSLRTIHCRHPTLTDMMVRSLSEPTGFRHFDAASFARCTAIVGMVPQVGQPQGLAARLLGVLGIPHEGWQRDASSFLEQLFLDSVLPRVSQDERALLRSQGGPLAALPFTAMPVSTLQRFDSDIFRVLLLRRLSLPLPLSSHSCRCGRPLDCLGHHRASCALASVLGRRGCALESAAARVCREAEARASTNVFLRDLDLVGICVQYHRRIEVIAEGLPVFDGAQLAIDTTLVSLLRTDVEPHRRCAEVDAPPNVEGFE